MRTLLPAELIFDLSCPASAAIDPSGEWVAFVRRVTPRGAGGRSTIELVSCDGRRSRTLTDDGRWGWVAWRPDGGVLAAVDGHAIVLLDAGNDADARTLCTAPWPSHLAWAPDGASIAFSACHPPPARAGGSAVAPMVVGDLAFRDDRRGMLGSAREQVHVVDVGAGEVRRVTEGRDDYAALAWSPDGRWLAAAALDFAADRSTAVVLDLVDGGRRDLLAPPAQAGAMIWSPAGRLMVAADPEGLWHPDVLYVGTPDDGLTAVGPPLDVCIDGGIAWLDEDRVLIAGLLDGTSGHWTLELSTRTLARVRDLSDARYEGLSVDRERTVAIQLRSTCSDPPSLVAVPLNGAPARPLDSSSARPLAGRLQARSERFVVRDGDVDVHATLLIPAGAGPHPVIVDVHGGPMGPGLCGAFEPRHALYAANGFLVVAPDPRCSGGYGRAYATDVARAGAMYDGTLPAEILAVVDAVLARPDADAARCGIYGSSFGGYAATWLLATTDRFAAGVVHAGIFDLASHVLTTDQAIGHTLREVTCGVPWERREHIARCSPSSHAHRISAPVLVSTGTSDLRVPAHQSEQLFATLQLAGVQSELVRYPAANHSVARFGHIEHRLDHLERTLAWFSKHLT